MPIINAGIEKIFLNNGEPTAIVVGAREKKYFNELLQAFGRTNVDGVVHVERQLGMAVMYYDSDFGSLPIILSRYIVPNESGETQAWILCEKTPGENVLEIAELQTIGMQPLAKIDDSERFMVNVYEATICRAPQWQTELSGLTS